MSNLPPNPYDRTVIVEPTLDAPDRAALQGTGRDFVVSLTTSAETPGAENMFLSRTGRWVSFASTELNAWGSIIGNISNQADLYAELQLRPLKTAISAVGYDGQYNSLLNKPVFGDLASVDFNGAASMFLRGDGEWAIPVDVYARWGNIAGSIFDQTDLIDQLALKAPITSPVFLGLPRAPTPAVDDSSDRISTSGWFFGQGFNANPVMDGVASSGDSLRWARGNHRHPTDVSRAALDSPQFIGLPTAPTVAFPNTSQLVATTAFVMAGLALAGGIPEAPNDGLSYVRKSNAWVAIDAATKWDKAS